MVEGTLSLDKFTYYVLQDAIYLTDFSYCLNRMSEKAPNEAHKRRLKEMALGAEECEKDLHRSFFKMFNIDNENVQPMPNTVLYTSYMIRVVETRPYEEGLAVCCLVLGIHARGETDAPIER
jgi:Putative transcription activator